MKDYRPKFEEEIVAVCFEADALRPKGPFVWTMKRKMVGDFVCSLRRRGFKPRLMCIVRGGQGKPFFYARTGRHRRSSYKQIDLHDGLVHVV